MAIYKRGASRFFWYEFEWQGKRIRESTKTDDPEMARQIEAAHKKRLQDKEVARRLAEAGTED